jgi:hypothetical protein
MHIIIQNQLLHKKEDWQQDASVGAWYNILAYLGGGKDVSYALRCEYRLIDSHTAAVQIFLRLERLT